MTRDKTSVFATIIPTWSRVRFILYAAGWAATTQHVLEFESPVSTFLLCDRATFLIEPLERKKINVKIIPQNLNSVFLLLVQNSITFSNNPMYFKYSVTKHSYFKNRLYFKMIFWNQFALNAGTRLKQVI